MEQNRSLYPRRVIFYGIFSRCWAVEVGGRGEWEGAWFQYSSAIRYMFFSINPI